MFESLETLFITFKILPAFFYFSSPFFSFFNLFFVNVNVIRVGFGPPPWLVQPIYNDLTTKAIKSQQQSVHPPWIVWEGVYTVFGPQNRPIGAYRAFPDGPNRPETPRWGHHWPGSALDRV